MLNVTRELIDGIRSAHLCSSSAHILANARVAIVARHGGPEDADALLDVFLEKPTESRRECVLEAVMRVGTHDTARRLASTCLSGGKLREEMRADVLHALGFLGFAEARNVLWTHAQVGSDYSQQRAASLGLLNLSCDGLERAIESAIHSCVGRNLFPEFLPVLACKVDNLDLLQTIFDLGRTTASTDCNGGIVYGIALFDEAGRSRFDQLLFDPQWETYGGGTGTQWWAYHGFRHLGGSLAGLAKDVRAGHNTLPSEAREYRTRVWLALTESGLTDPFSPIRGESYPFESAAPIYSAAFDWSSPDTDDSITQFARSNRRINRETAHAVRDRLADRIVAEVNRGASLATTFE